MDSNITSTSAADLRVEYEIELVSIVVALNTTVEIPATLQNKLDTVAAAKDFCLRDIREHLSLSGINSFYILPNKDANGNELYCNLPSDATALALLKCLCSCTSN